MKLYFSLLLATLLQVQILDAQRIYFCESYTSGGEPVGAGTVWNISETGGNAFILYQNGGRYFNGITMSFYIDYLSGSDYKAWDTKLLTVSSSQSWTVLDYKFTSAGSYRVTVLLNGVQLAKEYVTIKYKSGTVSGNSQANVSINYAKSSVIPGTDIDLTSGFVYGMNGPFYLNSRYIAKVYFKVSNGDYLLGTNKLIVDITKKNAAGTYEFYTTKNFEISNLNWVVFNYDFYSAGTYRVSVYNGNNVWINTAYATVH